MLNQTSISLNKDITQINNSIEINSKNQNIQFKNLRDDDNILKQDIKQSQNSISDLDSQIRSINSNLNQASNKSGEEIDYVKSLVDSLKKANSEQIIIIQQSIASEHSRLRNLQQIDQRDKSQDQVIIKDIEGLSEDDQAMSIQIKNNFKKLSDNDSL